MLYNQTSYQLESYHLGRTHAEKDVDRPNFDVDEAILSFDYDPPDTPYQRGYLRGLLKCGYANVTSPHDKPT
tara:strand:- start:5887 stop:6102 length:216 start_codon:yes stop_codon:yes gene_type:complete